MSEKCGNHGVIEVRIDNIDEKVKGQNERLTNVEKTHIELMKMNVLFEAYIEDSKQMFKEHSQTLKNINTTLGQIESNLTQLSTTVTNLDNRVVDLEGSVKKIDENSTINWHELVKKVLIMGAISIVSMAAMFIYTNMK